MMGVLTYRLDQLNIDLWQPAINGTRWGWCPACQQPTVAWSTMVVNLRPTNRYSDTHIALDIYLPCGCVAAGTALRGRLHIADVTRLILEEPWR